MKSKISVVTGAHPTKKKERIYETVLYTFVLIVSIAIVSWLFHLTDGWLVLLLFGFVSLIYFAIMYDTWTRQSTLDRKIIDNPVYEKDKE